VSVSPTVATTGWADATYRGSRIARPVSPPLVRPQIEFGRGVEVPSPPCAGMDTAWIRLVYGSPGLMLARMEAANPSDQALIVSLKWPPSGATDVSLPPASTTSFDYPTGLILTPTVGDGGETLLELAGLEVGVRWA